MKNEIVIVDYGLGNLASIRNMIKKAGGRSMISSDLDHIHSASKLILPGVGSFKQGMENLRSSGIGAVLQSIAKDGDTHIMGICLGMQLLADYSEEGDCEGLGLIPGRVLKFDRSRLHDSLKIPHMGWADIEVKKTHWVFQSFSETPRFYFVHSYYFEPANSHDTLCTTVHGNPFVSGVSKGRILGLQFHPEKSHKFGLQLMKNLIELEV